VIFIIIPPKYRMLDKTLQRVHKKGKRQGMNKKPKQWTRENQTSVGGITRHLLLYTHDIYILGWNLYPKWSVHTFGHNIKIIPRVVLSFTRYPLFQ
jgi:hypothetical protein